MFRIIYLLHILSFIWISFNTISQVNTQTPINLSKQSTRNTFSCNKDGTFCKDCKTVVECFNIFEDTWLTSELDICQKSCLNGACTINPNPDCDEQKGTTFQHKCRQLGLFPHPFDRCQYFMCSMDQKTVSDTNAPVPESSASASLSLSRFDCPPGYLFDPKTTLCRIKAADGSCPALIDQCQKAGDRGSIPGNPSMYYICLKDGDNTTPNILLCTGSSTYDAAKKSCVDRESGLDADGKCKAKGLFYNPKNCLEFYDCLAKGSNPLKRNCPFRRYFSEESKKCLDFTCILAGLDYII